jgi:tetratricopeptide (TPR) repeat protein
VNRGFNPHFAIPFRNWQARYKIVFDPGVARSMTRESLVFAVCGAFFGLIVGWMIGSQQPARELVPSAPAQAESAAQSPGGQRQPPALDQERAQTLLSIVQREPTNVTARVQLANLYYDAERYEEAARWYEQALKLNPDDVNVSTDLGVSYYYLNQPDRALEQFAHSLRVDPRHTKTMLNIGVVRAFGKQDLEGAAVAWRQVVEIAPDSAEGRTAKQALDNLQSAHPGLGQQPPGS